MEMSQNDDYKLYEVLECTKESSYEEIKRAYHKLALLHHPDKKTGKLPADNKTFLKIKAAWRILGNAERRKKYDAECRQAELESDNILIYDRIKLSDMKMEDDEKLLSFPCRCGNNYLINKSDFIIEEETIYVACQECTFSIAINVDNRK